MGLLSKLLRGGSRAPIPEPKPDPELDAYYGMAQVVATQKCMVFITNEEYRPERVPLEPNGRARLMIYSLVGLAAIRRFLPSRPVWETMDGHRDYLYALKLASELGKNHVPTMVDLMKKAQVAADELVESEWPWIEPRAKGFIEHLRRA
jgi:hypothetical protein